MATINRSDAPQTVKSNPIDQGIPEDDPMFGEYVPYGNCGACGASRWINDTRARLIATRPVIIYTCENALCPGRLTDDPYWKPKTFNIGM